MLKKLSDEAKKNELIFFVSAGPAANIIISFLMKINNKNIYIDFGSSIEIITKGYSTRPYTDKNSQYSQQSCESFYIQNKTLIYDWKINEIILMECIIKFNIKTSFNFDKI